MYLSLYDLASNFSSYFRHDILNDIREFCQCIGHGLNIEHAGLIPELCSPVGDNTIKRY